MVIKYIFALIIALHGLIHLMGFAKAFSYGNMVQLTKDISKPVGYRIISELEPDLVKMQAEILAAV